MPVCSCCQERIADWRVTHRYPFGGGTFTADQCDRCYRARWLINRISILSKIPVDADGTEMLLSRRVAGPRPKRKPKKPSVMDTNEYLRRLRYS